MNPEYGITAMRASGPACSHQIPQRSFVVRGRYRREVAAPHEFGIEAGDQVHIVQAAQPRDPICLVAAHYEFPLQRLAHFEIVAISAHVLFERFDARAVRALGIEQNRAARTQRLASVLQSLVRLAQIDIHGKAARRSDHQIVRLVEVHAQHLVHRAAAFAMRQIVMPGHHANQLALGAEHHVHDEIGIGHAAGLQQIFVRGIAIQLSGPAVGVEDHAVIERGGTKARHAGAEALAPARVAGDQMVNDLARKDDAVGFPHLRD